MVQISFPCGWLRLLLQPRLVAVLLLSICCPVEMIAQQGPTPKMSLVQIEGLVEHAVPDSTLSAQIKRRGIDFAPTPATLDVLRAKGAGPLTLEAIGSVQREAPPTTPAVAGVRENSAPAAGQGKMTQAQLQHLLQIRASDLLVSQQIKARSLAFSPTNAEVQSFQVKGAGPQTVEVLSSFVQTGAIQIRTEPGAAVSLDGRQLGKADATGLIAATDVIPGGHTLGVQKDGFKVAQQDFKLENRESSAVSVPMTWAGGVLTVAVQPPGASVSITGAANYSGPQSSTRVPPGNYSVAVSQPGYITQTQSFAVAAGESHQETVELKADPTYLAASVKAAESAMRSGDTDGALRAAGEAYSLDPSNAATAKILSEASFVKGNAGPFIKYGLMALHGGQTISVPMMHVRNFPKRTAEGAVIMISKTDVEFSCLSEGKCPMPKSVAYDCIYNLSAMNDTTGTRVLHVTYSDKPHSSIVHDLDFVPAGSTVEKEIQQPGGWLSATQSVIKLPPNSGDQYQEIIQFINNVRR